MPEERIQKVLSRWGIASRREAERMLLEHRITVNGRLVTEPGTRVDPERDHIKVDGKLVRPPRGPRTYLLAYKPREMITSLHDPEGRPTIADLLRRARVRKRVFPVGRLDWDADGLLLLTDDGELANRVMHPRTHLPKVYLVKVKGHPTERALDRVRRGVVIEPRVRTLPAEVTVEKAGENATWLRVTLVEGRQNQIKRMFARVGHPVRKIRRIALGPLRLGKMRIGEVRPLSPGEVRRLREAVGLPVEEGALPRSRRTGSRGASRGPGSGRRKPRAKKA